MALGHCVTQSEEEAVSAHSNICSSNNNKRQEQEKKENNLRWLTAFSSKSSVDGLKGRE